MIILAFDTSLNACSVAIQKDNILVCQKLKIMDKGQAEELIPLAIEVLAEAGMKWEDIDGLGVTLGPGTFTGIRVGIAAARGIALVRNIPVLGYTSLHTIAKGALRTGKILAQEELLVMSDARRNEVYIQYFGANSIPSGPPALISTFEINNWLPSYGIALAGSAVAILQSLNKEISERFKIIKDLNFPEAQDVAFLAEEQMIKSDWVYQGPPSPIYLREPHTTIPK